MKKAESVNEHSIFLKISEEVKMAQCSMFIFIYFAFIHGLKKRPELPNNTKFLKIFTAYMT